MTDESPFEFPCDFPIKAFGYDNGVFADHVVRLIHPHAPEVSRAAARARPSRGGHYVAVTVTVRATSREQLDRIYRTLSADDGVLFAL